MGGLDSKSRPEQDVLNLDVDANNFGLLAILIVVLILTVTNSNFLLPLIFKQFSRILYNCISRLEGIVKSDRCKLSEFHNIDCYSCNIQFMTKCRISHAKADINLYLLILIMEARFLPGIRVDDAHPQAQVLINSIIQVKLS